MALDPRTPVIVGVGQVNRPGPDEPEPVDLLVEAAERAGADCGAPQLLAGLESVRVVKLLSWPYRDLGALVAARLGAAPGQTMTTFNGGQTPQALVHRTAADIAAGRADVVLIGGVESWRARMAAKGRGERPAWTSQPDDVAPDEVFGTDLPLVNEVEQAIGLAAPIQFYPLFEIAVRAGLGRAPADHLQRVSELWERFSTVATANPHAALRRQYTAEEIGTPHAGNRMVGYPYTKLLNSNNHVNQAAALLVTSLERARQAGVPADRMVFPWSGAEADDTPSVSNRAAFDSSPAIRSAAGRALQLSGLGIDDVALLDIYSCFPSAVQIAARETGVTDDRPLTVTGGLTFAGGPWNNYVTHAVATMVERLRETSGVGVCTANGGLLTKHAVGVYSAAPPPVAFRSEKLGTITGAARQLAGWPQPGAVVEAYTVMHDRDGIPARAHLTALVADGRRVWGHSTDPDVLDFLTSDDACGMAVDLLVDGTVRFGARARVAS